MIAAIVELRARVLLLEDLDEWVDVEGLEGAVSLQGGGVVPYVQLVVEEPHVALDGDAACAEGGEERHPPPVVVMAVAGDGEDVAREVGWVPGQSFGAGAWTSPVLEVAVDVGGPDEGREDEEEIEG